MKEKIAGISVVVNLVLAIGKIVVGITVNSAAILAEGLHSGMDVLSSAISFFGIRKAKKPSDKEHPYGHYKFEVFAGLIITLILLGTGIGIAYEAYKSFLNPGKVEITYPALGVMIFSALINEIMSRIKIHFGKKEDSMSLLSDGFHSRVDVYTSIAVLFGLILNKFWIYADPLLALLIGVYIIKQSFSLGKNATDSLLDTSAGEIIENKIKEIAKGQRIEVSELKTQKRGSAITANLEIKLPNKLSVEEATKISDNLREKLIENIENLKYVAIQIKSHEVSTGFYKSPMGFGRGFGWQRKGTMIGMLEETKGLGPDGFCVCPKCGYKIKHERGIPCSTMKCPKCGSLMVRGD
jgi:cation diffusion facilitator family transporter